MRLLVGLTLAAIAMWLGRLSAERPKAQQDHCFFESQVLEQRLDSIDVAIQSLAEAVKRK